MRDLEADGGGTREHHGRFPLVAVEEGGGFDAGGDVDGVQGGLGVEARCEAFDDSVSGGEVGEGKEVGEEHDEEVVAGVECLWWLVMQIWQLMGVRRVEVEGGEDSKGWWARCGCTGNM